MRRCDPCCWLLGWIVVLVAMIVVAVLVQPLDGKYGAILLYALLGLAFLTICLLVPCSIYAGIPPLPSSAASCDAVIDAIPLAAPGRIGELGCGWGDLALALADRFEGSEIVGFEMSPLPYAVASCRGSAVPNLEVRLDDFSEEDLGEFDLLICYLSDEHVAALATQLTAQIRKECVVVSSTFAVREWPLFAR
eukprot:TRINITY_DN25600_c0_g1_i1.p1 TRINITY_DN25600_c0_g1~~TRINITY_DN25600_c0_g1_i1.p1  ORF type:complete len:193 (+),score=32.21 TRINITY_DN25600_c0_g1_i1:68-646(+)